MISRRYVLTYTFYIYENRRIHFSPTKDLKQEFSDSDDYGRGTFVDYKLTLSNLLLMLHKGVTLD